MAKIVLGSQPKNFKRIVKIQLLNGETADLEISYKYRTRTQYAELLDKLIGKETPQQNQPNKTLAQVFKESDQASVAYILDIADGWDLADEFNKKNVAALIDEHAGAGAVIGEEYRIALLEGRTKN